MSEYILDKKELKRRIVKLSKKCLPSAQRGIIDPILKYPDFRKAIYHQASIMMDLANAADECSRMKAAGMVIYNGEVYPVKIIIDDDVNRCLKDGWKQDLEDYETELDEDRAWMIENEAVMVTACAHALMNSLNMDHLACQVVLFRSRNFSGVRHQREIKRNANTLSDTRIGNTNYFV